MNRTNICKNIVQSIKDYITDQVKLEPHRVEKHFVRRRKLSLLQVIIYLFFSSKASMFQNLSQIREELGTLSFPDVSKQALSKARQFIRIQNQLLISLAKCPAILIQTDVIPWDWLP